MKERTAARLAHFTHQLAARGGGCKLTATPTPGLSVSHGCTGGKSLLLLAGRLEYLSGIFTGARGVLLITTSISDRTQEDLYTPSGNGLIDRPPTSFTVCSFCFKNQFCNYNVIREELIIYILRQQCVKTEFSVIILWIKSYIYIFAHLWIAIVYQQWIKHPFYFQFCHACISFNKHHDYFFLQFYVLILNKNTRLGIAVFYNLIVFAISVCNGK